MKPLQSVAMGLVVVVLAARVAGHDVLADPAGWLLVLLGVARLPADLPRRDTLLALAALAGLVSAVLWFPSVAETLAGADPALTWTANLPQLAFSALLCHQLAARAAASADTRAARWLRTTRTGCGLLVLLPVLVFGGGLTSLEVPSYLAAGAVALLLICLLFRYAARAWAVPAGAPASADRADRAG